MLSPMLTHAGRLYGDVTVACLADDYFMVLGSGAMQEAHRRWFEQKPAPPMSRIIMPPMTGTGWR